MKLADHYKWESDNSLTRDIQLTQAYLLHLEVGLWSGDSRKTELSEAFTNPIITMMRRGNRLRRSHYPSVNLSSEDEGDALQTRWKAWIELELSKRLVYCTANYDMHQSLVFWTQPLISYSELGLPLPDSNDLWSAGNASLWKTIYLSKTSNASFRRPSLLDCLSNVGNLTASHHLLDRKVTTMSILGGAWRLIWEYRQQCLLRSGSSQPTYFLSSRIEEIRNLLQDIRYSEMLMGPGSEESQLEWELLSMHLHMSFGDVQSFAGIDGQEESKKVYPELREWAKTMSARDAIWHAGQVIRIAKQVPKGSLVAFPAVAVYQAALAFWTYGLMMDHNDIDPNLHQPAPLVWLDEPETEDKQRFIRHDIGQPALRGLNNHTNTSSPSPAALTQPSHVMDVIIHVLRTSLDVPGVPRPVLVENLIQLMTGLRSAGRRPGES